MKVNLKIIVLVLILTVLPLGQLVRIDNLFGFNHLNLLAIDAVALLSVIFIKPYYKKFKLLFGSIIVYIVFINFLSLLKFNPSQVFIGSFYFVRLIIYFCLFIVVRESISKQFEKHKLLLYLLISVLVLSVFGWIQYFIFPNLTELKFLGWDDHLYRMTSTMLDPNYLGALFLIGISIANYFFVRSKNRKYLLTIIFLVISILFTYSRATYLGLFILLAVAFLRQKLHWKYFLIFLFSVFFILFLPRYQSEGVKLERLHSVFTRIRNYKEFSNIIYQNPLFGIGYNNLCAYRGEFQTQSRSCAGSDSSMLYILSTTGVIGLLLFIDLGQKIYGKIYKSDLILVKPLFASLFVHSFFNNTLFYPYVAVPLVLILGALSVRVKDKN
ncbi:MAG TPA: O-antigen ligase family protein [Patescibacteria group bacterium]|nr:O-antigen ligase family protein [Patescibacteria group bacterium]